MSFAARVLVAICIPGSRGRGMEIPGIGRAASGGLAGSASSRMSGIDSAPYCRKQIRVILIHRIYIIFDLMLLLRKPGKFTRGNNATLHV